LNTQRHPRAAVAKLWSTKKVLCPPLRTHHRICGHGMTRPCRSSHAIDFCSGCSLRHRCQNCCHGETRPHSGQWLRRWNANNSWRFLSQHPHRRTVLRARPHRTAHPRIEAPHSRLSSASPCTLHKCQRRGGSALGSDEQLRPHPALRPHRKRAMATGLSFPVSRSALRS